MSTTVDPSWLPSTVAQSTAALVGILGGLLVARFMSIDSEQSSLRARRAETKERLDFLTRTRDELEASSLRRSAVGVLSHASVVEELLSPPDDGSQDTDAFMLAAGIDGWTAEELDPFLTEARDVIHECGRRLLEVIEGEDGEDQAWLQVRRQLNLSEDDWDEVREEAHVQIKKTVREQRAAEAEQHRRRYGGPSLGNSLYNSALNRIPDYSGLLSATESTYTATARAAEVERRTQAHDDVKRAQFEFDLADRALRDAALPGSLMAAVWMLAGLTAVGLVLPVVALFALPSYDSYVWRLVVLVAFCVGIGALLIYLFVSATRLRPRADTTLEASALAEPSAT